MSRPLSVALGVLMLLAIAGAVFSGLAPPPDPGTGLVF